MSTVEIRPAGHMQHEDGDVVVLLVTGEHPVNQVLQQPGRVLNHSWPGLRRHCDQFVEPSVQATATGEDSSPE